MEYQEIKAEKLLKIIKKDSLKIGICFHVGSQCMNPWRYIKNAMEYSKKIVEASGVQINYQMLVEVFRPIMKITNLHI